MLFLPNTFLNSFDWDIWAHIYTIVYDHRLFFARHRIITSTNALLSIGNIWAELIDQISHICI